MSDASSALAPCQACEHKHPWHTPCTDLVAMPTRPGYGIPCVCRMGAAVPGRSPRRSIPDAVRRLVLDRDGLTCKSCGVRVWTGRRGRQWPKKAAHLDHIVPVSRGGLDSPDNLRVLCATCNTRRGNRDESLLEAL